jgi:hypothetical protein
VELGAPTVSFIGLARQIVASSRGSGSWRISQENRKVERFPWPARQRVTWSSKLSHIQLTGSAERSQSAIRVLAFFCRVGRSALHLKVRRRKRKQNCENEYYKSDQFGYTSIEASKCSSISQSHYEHLMLLSGNCPTAPGNLFGH